MKKRHAKMARSWARNNWNNGLFKTNDEALACLKWYWSYGSAPRSLKYRAMRRYLKVTLKADLEAMKGERRG